MTSAIMTGGGKPLTIAGKLALLFAEAAAAPIPVPDPAAPMPAAGMSGWWDASALAWGSNPNGLTDKSTAGKSATFSYASAPVKAIPRQAGMLGGVYAEGNAGSYSAIFPIITDYAVNASGVAAGSAFTVFMAWSRANLRQPAQGTLSNETVTLLSIDGTAVLAMTGNGAGSDSLVLFPGSSAVTGAALELRHTHAARVVFNGSSVDVWLDGTKVITAAANQITLGVTANLSFLNASQCIFHEAAAWGHALSTSEHADLTGYSHRWPLGPRRAANGLWIGQSNASNMIGNVVWPVINRHVAYWTGCIASNLLYRAGGTANISAGSTIFSGQGLYDSTANLLLDGSSAADPSTWALGVNGVQLMAAIDAMTADQRANLRYVAWFWSESDSGMLTYAAKPKYLAAMKRAFALIRAHLGMSAAQLPVLVINALPQGGSSEGSQTHREVMQDLVDDPTQNVAFMLAQTDDTSGDNTHRDATGLTVLARRMGAPIARAVIQANAAGQTLDVLTALDVSVPVTGGPKITGGHHEGGTSVLATVAHDGGSDLIVPAGAAGGIGWTLMDGVSDTVAGTPGAPGALIAATSCVRVSATQLRVTLASIPAHPAKARLYYGYGNGTTGNAATIDAGNAVTDNFGSTTLTAGWKIGADLGVAEQSNNPLRATTYGVPLS